MRLHVRPSMPGRNRALIDRLIARGALWSPALMAAFRATPRQFFLERIHCHGEPTWVEVDAANPSSEALRLVYSDRALTTRLEEGVGPPVPVSSSSQPSLMAQMLEDLDLRPGLRCLEIGSGTGYNAALLAHVVGPVGTEREARMLFQGLPEKIVVKRRHDQSLESGHHRSRPETAHKSTERGIRSDLSLGIFLRRYPCRMVS